MFKRNFIRICAERGVAPTAVLKNIGLSNATFSCWTDESVPRETTLLKLSDYLDVTVEDLLRDPDEQFTTDPAPTAPAPEPSSVTSEIYKLIDELTVKELRELTEQIKDTIKNRK